jgi:transposase-like protein
MAIKNEILDELLKDKDPKTIFSSEGLLGELKKALAERVLNAEMDPSPCRFDARGGFRSREAGNRRNDYSKKTVLTENEAIEPAMVSGNGRAGHPNVEFPIRRPPLLRARHVRAIIALR